MDMEKWNEENDRINQYLLDSGYTEDKVEMTDYVQTTDDCDWVF